MKRLETLYSGCAEVIFGVIDHKTGKKRAWPPVHLLIWKEDAHEFVHCLEFDLIAEGKNFQEAVNRLMELIFEQMHMAQTEHTQLYHPAPTEYWEKLYEIQRNHLTQALLERRPQSREDIVKVSELMLTHA